jgi:transmembrane sensor
MVREVLTLDRLRALPPDEAAAYFVTRAAEGLTEGEQAIFAEWLAADEAHRRAVAEADRVWSLFGDTEGDEILEAFRAHARLARPVRSSAWNDLPRIAAAAAILVVVGVSILMLGPNPFRNSSGGEPVEAVAYATAVGQVKDVALPDGSHMTLDADSAAVARIGSGHRSVELTRGRALFGVAHDPAHPFTVVASGERLVALGTHFDVNLGTETLTVTLLDGRLAVGPAGRSTVSATLEPGQQLIHSPGGDHVRAIGSQGQDIVAWQAGLIRFDNQTLIDAVATMNRYSHVRIVIRDPCVAALRVSGQFRAGQSEGFAETLAELYGLHARQEKSEIDLYAGRSCAPGKTFSSR